MNKYIYFYVYILCILKFYYYIINSNNFTNKLLLYFNKFINHHQIDFLMIF